MAAMLSKKFFELQDELMKKLQSNRQILARLLNELQTTIERKSI